MKIYNNELNINGLGGETIDKLLCIQQTLRVKKGNDMSIENIIDFLMQIMNFSGFQMQLMKLGVIVEDLSVHDKIKLFLSETSIDEILRLYDIWQNFDKSNVENIESMMETSELENHYTIFVNEKGNGKNSNITLESRKRKLKV